MKVLVLISGSIVVVGLLLVGGFLWQRHREEQARVARVAQEKRACEDALTPTIQALSDLDAKLDVGIVEADYTRGVQDAQVAWSRVDVSQLGSSCQQAVGVHIESALDQLRAASDEWNDCLTDLDCDTDGAGFSSKLQTHWLLASTEIEAAKEAIADPTGVGRVGDPVGL